jgi:hypothetical protein
VELGGEDVTPESLRMLMDTVLDAIDHLEKKWLDEQIRHEERQRKHREDVARLSQQVRELEVQQRKRIPLYKKGARLVQSLWLRTPAAQTVTAKHQRNYHEQAAHSV